MGRAATVMSFKVSLATLFEPRRHSGDTPSRAGKVKKLPELVTVQVYDKAEDTNITVFDIKTDEGVVSRKSFIPATLIPLDVGDSSQSESSSSSSGSSRSSSIIVAGDESDTELEDVPNAPPMMKTISDFPPVKVCDFAYARSSTSPSTSTRTREKDPIPEVFDQHMAIAEYELRMREVPRVFPISGKTLHRLFELGCITESEANERWKTVDWNAFLMYKAKAKHYPYRIIRNLPIPKKRKDREKIMKAKAMEITFFDRVRENAINKERASLRAAGRRAASYHHTEQGIAGVSVAPGLTRRAKSTPNILGMLSATTEGDSEDLDAIHEVRRTDSDEYPLQPPRLLRNRADSLSPGVRGSIIMMPQEVELAA